MIAITGGIFPVPEAGRPMPLLSLVQEYVVVPPVADVISSMAAVVDPLLATTWLIGRVICAIGFTVMVNLLEGPAHPTPKLLYVGTTVIVEFTGEEPRLVALKE